MTQCQRTGPSQSGQTSSLSASHTMTVLRVTALTTSSLTRTLRSQLNSQAPRHPVMDLMAVQAVEAPLTTLTPILEEALQEVQVTSVSLI